LVYGVQTSLMYQFSCVCSSSPQSSLLDPKLQTITNQ